MHIEVHQRLQPGVGPGPIHVVKKVLQQVEFGSTVKKVRVPVYLDHTLPAGTGALTASDRQALSQEGLSAREIAHIEAKLPEKKVRSDLHQAAFEAERDARLRKKLAARLIAQLTADGDLREMVFAELGGAADDTAEKSVELPPSAAVSMTLSDKVSSMLALVDEVIRDIHAYKQAAKVGRFFNQDKLQAMLSKDAERDWKLCWFSFSRMIEQAAGTPYARQNGWSKDPELVKLADAHRAQTSAP